MNISVIGSGYVGLVCGAGFAKMGNSVVCVDQDEEKIQRLLRGEVPIYEPGLSELVREGMAGNVLEFTTDIGDAVRRTEMCFIAVGTPMDEDGSADLSHVLDVAAAIGKHMTKHITVFDKSTVPVGTADRVRETVRRELAARGSELTFDVVSNPEFLKEGSAVGDFLKPDRIVIGADNERALKAARRLYAPFSINHDVLIAMDVRSAEMTKYAANAMLAAKISFMNEMANICERAGADINKVRIGIGSDPRIGYHFIYPGCGYGGSCFPKDVQALIRTAHSFNYTPAIMQAVEDVNNRQKEVLVDKVRRLYGDDLSGRVFALWGLAFKPGTDDMREAPSLTVVRRLTALGARVQAYDPKATEHARAFYFKDNPAISYFPDRYSVLKDVDGLLLLTDWSEFRSPDFPLMRGVMRRPVIFDGRNQYDGEMLEEEGFEYYQIGVGIMSPGT